MFFSIIYSAMIQFFYKKHIVQIHMKIWLTYLRWSLLYSRLASNYVAQNDLELILLFTHPQSWIYRYAPGFNMVLLCTQSKYQLNYFRLFSSLTNYKTYAYQRIIGSTHIAKLIKLYTLKMYNSPVMVKHVFNPALSRNRDANLCEVQAFLFYITSCKQVRASYWDPV